MTEQQGEYRVTDRKYRRLGKFYLDSEIVMDGVAGEFLEQMKFTPWRVEHLVYRDQFEFIGLSFMFDEANEAESLPVYRVDCGLSDDGSGSLDYSVQVERVYE